MNLFVIIGEDDYLVQETAKRHFIDGAEMDVIDSNTSTKAELQIADIKAADESFSTPPFLYPAKVTWWKNVGFLPQGGNRGPSAEVKAALEKFAEKLAANPLAENQVFILSGSKLLASSRFAKALKGAAEMALFAAGKKTWELAREAEARVQEFAAEMGLKFERGAAEAFVARVGTDTRSLVSELGKMRDYLGPAGRVITAAAVDEISSQGAGVEPELWAVTDAIGERDAARLFTAVRRFEQEAGFSVLMTTVVEKFLRQLLELKDAAERGEFAAATAGMAPFAARKNAGFIRNWTLAGLKSARAKFFELRERAVSSGGNIDDIVIATLMRLCRRRA